MLDGSGGVLSPRRRLQPLVQNGADVPPLQMSHSLWDIWIERRPGLSETAHVLQIGPGQTCHVWEFHAQVLGQPSDDSAPPPINRLAFQNNLSNRPVQLD